MSKSSLLLLFGGLVAVASFLGVPSSWKTIIFSVLGMLIIVMALLLRRDIATGALCLHLTQEKRTDSYRQSGAFRDNNRENNHEHKKEKKEEDEKVHEHNQLTAESQT